MIQHINHYLTCYLPRERRRFDRRRLPLPVNYYVQEFPELKHKTLKSAWINVRCCFHDDSQPSLGIHLISGGFYCFACNAKGGDVLAFHRMRYKLNFIEAIDLLGAWHEY